VVVTSDKVYRSKSGELWVESDPLVASEPYPVSKACAEFVTADYYAQYLRPLGKRVGVARAGNVVLGGDPYSSRTLKGGGHLHVDCFEALIAGRPPEIFSPMFTRPYTYGLDIIAGYMALMARLDEPGVDGEPFNFGPRESMGIENGVIASTICSIWNSGITWKAGNPRPEPFEKQSISWEKAKERLDWRPIYRIQETLEDVASWYRAWAATAPGKGAMVETDQRLLASHAAAARHQQAWWAEDHTAPAPSQEGK
jgi:CDP-glucose 4,6-dehydratase